MICSDGCQLQNWHSLVCLCVHVPHCYTCFLNSSPLVWNFVWWVKVESSMWSGQSLYFYLRSSLFTSFTWVVETSRHLGFIMQQEMVSFQFRLTIVKVQSSLFRDGSHESGFPALYFLSFNDSKSECELFVEFWFSEYSQVCNLREVFKTILGVLL